MSITAQQSTAVPTGSWNADRVHSSVSFEVTYMGLQIFRGEVKDFDASLVDRELSGSARIASLVTKDENLQAHLLSPEFFDAERFPEVGFSGTAVETAGPEVAFEGEITIKGITRPATLTGVVVGLVEDPYGNERYSLQLDTTIDRTEFGILWNAEMPNGTKALADDVTLRAELSLVKQA